MRNDPAASGLRAPRPRLVVGGRIVTGVEAVSITSNNHYAADRFRARIALGEAQPGWAMAETLEVAIGITLGTGTGMTPLIEGIADTLEIDTASNTLLLTGRDRTALLIEARTHETFANRTASEIASLLAARHGLEPDVAETKTPVGRYWDGERDAVSLGEFARATTEWDLLASLARIEGFDVWVSGRTLHFRPPAAQAEALLALRARGGIGGGANVTALRLHRALTLAADIEVVVKSWNAQRRKAFVQTARRSRTPGSRPRTAPRRYVYVVPNLTEGEALALAQRRLAELSRHERVVVAEMPGELALAPRMRVRLEGTGSAFDQEYWIDEIERRIDMRHGFTQTLRATNAEGDSTATQGAGRGATSRGATWNGF